MAERLTYNVSLLYDNDLEIKPTISLGNDPVIDVYNTDDLEMTLTPDEADLLALALVKAAEDARRIKKG